MSGTIPLPLPFDDQPDISEMSANDLLAWVCRRAIASGLRQPPPVPIRWRTADADYLVGIHVMDYSPPAREELEWESGQQ